MTSKELEAIKRRADAATPGDWLLFNGWGPLESDGLYRVVKVGKRNSMPVLATELYSSDIKGTKEDFEFIAHARTDVPALVSEVERLRNALVLAKMVVPIHERDVVNEICAALEE